MDGSDLPKARRPLPTPGANNVQTTQQRPSTPVQSSIQRPIPPSQFYGSSKPPALPSRPNRNAGSSHTAYTAPVNDPPRYGSPSIASQGFREPELIVEEPVVDSDEQLPELIPNHNYQWEAATSYGDWTQPTPPWDSTAAAWDPPQTQWPENTVSTGTFDTMDFVNTNLDSDVPINGRSDYEETRWWNQEEISKNGRPGPGLLPPVVAEDLHDPHHLLFSVNISGIPQPSSSTPLPSAVPLTASASTDSYAAAAVFPSPDEVRAAVPHPNAYYCPKENGWVLMIWKSSAVLPPLTLSFHPIHPLPDQSRRKRTPSCVPEGDNPTTLSNKTHHFHRYPKAVDSLQLTSPFREDPWRVSEILKQKRRAQFVVDEVDQHKVDQFEELDNLEPQGRTLDLYVCCQCSMYCLASDVIPGVVQQKHLEEFVREKRNNPQPGKSPELSVTIGIETLLLAIENKMFKGNHRLIKIRSTGFQAKLGWNPNIKRIFESIGFHENSSNGVDSTLVSPVTDPTSQEGLVSRRKLMRAWVELSAWLADFRRVHSGTLRDHSGSRIYVQIDGVRDMYQRGIGAHPGQIPRADISDPALNAARVLHDAWRGLGLTPSSFSPDLLAFAYLAQCRCDPAGTPRYFTYLSDIVNTLQNAGGCPPQLQELMAMESSRNRFTVYEIQTAAQNLGFGHDGFLRVEYDEDVEEEFVENAWRDAIKRSWKDPLNGSEIQRTANEALRILAEARGSVKLRQLWETGKNSMSPDRAYDTLEIPKEVDDGMLITVFNMRIEESTQMDKMREALSVIGEFRDSERLRQFLATSIDPGDIIAPTRADFPRGLNQLGNTCYLNSLLQYFYTIKELREAVIPMLKLDLKALEEDKLSDEEISKHRVGGRRVNRREIIRSKKFIHQLAELFWSLEYSETSAVTPTIELAKLALVTSRDEEEDDEADKGGSDSSNDTDATLVDGEPSRVSVPEKDASSTVLGKRPRDLDRQTSVMDVDNQDVDGFVMIDSPQRTTSPEAMDTSSTARSKDKDGDVIMQGSSSESSSEKPAMPKRRASTVEPGGMMFGKQHDVAECMDNCMFQIETALLKFGSKSDVGSDKSGVVKRLFFGKIRQRLTSASTTSRNSIHEKQDLFSHLPVNVTNDGVDIYDGLSGYFDDVVDYEGGQARMEVTLVDLPPLLQIQLQRVQFNRETLQPYKSQAYVKFGETVYLDRFMDNVDPRKKAKSKAIQRELSGCRERIQLLLDNKNGAITSTLDHTANYLAALQQNSVPGVEDYMVVELRSEKRRIEAEIDDLRARVDVLKEELEALWANSKDYAYELTSVFIHRGSSPSFGHYFFYSRHLPDSPDSWFKYNDSDVGVVSKDEVLQDTTGSTANPYLLVFARKGSNVVETVNRFDASKLESP
ncbi:ubiquitin C-terminal hydrolase Ubp2 [Coprinopsis marcescibilis]|uniref:ubiquitinyl hydrolase 1 n=1 Tax=Coprinopsis marcescibilis TaxID=230819 RepID=A0A5C3L1S8_COPMA|nr:ubiquitin C-terminal hydrolase Ubp2 [Coprinopsis marcescibilis]